MRRFPEVGEMVCIRGYESLPFEVVEVARERAEPIRLLHPLSGATMTFRRSELVAARPPEPPHDP